MGRPDFTPQQLAELNKIFGKQKTRRVDYSAGSGAAVPVLPEPEPSPEQRMLATPEAARLRERGYNDAETLDALTRQMMIPGKDVLSSLPDKRYKAPEIDPTVLPGDTPSYTTFNGDVLTKDDADMDRWTAWRREPENAEALFRMKTGKSSMQYEKELKENLRRELTGILERANGRIGETEKRAAEAVGSGFVGTLAKAQIYGMPKMSKGGKDADLAVMAKRILGQLDSKTMKDRDEGDKSSGLWRGIKNNLTAEDFLSAGYSSILENLLEAQTLDKANGGGNLTDTEKDVLRLKQLEGKVNDYLDLRGGKTRGATVGGFVGDSAPFMAQFGLTSGVTALPSVGRAVAGKLLKTGMNAGIKQGIAKGLAKSVGAVSRMGAEAGAMLPLQASPYNNFLERTAGQYHVGDDGAVTKFATPAFVRAYKGLADAYVDVFTEKTGEGFGVLFNSLVGKPVARLAKNMGVERYIRRIPRNEVLDGLRHRLAYNGPVGEFMEEMEGNLLAPLLTGEHERWKEGFSGENVWNTLLTTTIMWGGFKTLEIPHMADYAVRSAKLHGAEKKALSGIQSPELKTAVFAAMQQPTLATQSKALSGIDWNTPGITGMDAAHAVDYARFRTERTILDGATRGLQYAEKIDGIYNELQRFQYRGEDGRTPSGEIVTAQAQDGNTYPVLSGGLSAESLDDNLFVWDERAQQARQISRTELQDVQRVPVNEFVAEQYRQRDEAQEAEQQAERAQEDVAAGVEAGIAPEQAQRIVMAATEPATVQEAATEAEQAGKVAAGPEVVPDVEPKITASEATEAVPVPGTEADGTAQTLSEGEPFTNEDAVTLTDGRRGVVVGRETGGYIVELDGGTFVKVPYNRVTGRAGEQEAAPVPVVPVEPERPTMAVPATEPPAQSAETPTKIPAAEPQVEMPTAELVRTRRLKVRKRQVSPYAAKAAALGDFVSIEDVILRDVAAGLRFVWGNRGNNRGLAEELGFTGNETERRARIGILSNDGITPEHYAERLYFEHGAGNDDGIGNRWNLDDKNIKDTLLDILLRVLSPKKAYEEAVRLHEGETNPYESYTEEELARMQRYEAARQAETERAMADPDIIALWESTTPEQQAEIDNLFAESSSDFAENANFEPLAEQSGAAIDKFNQILSDENRTDTATDTARPAIRAIGENRGAAGGSQQRNTESGSGPDKGEPGAGPSAVRHDGGGLEPVRPDLTDEEQRVADETTAGIDDRLEELNTDLRGKLSQYAAEKRKIGGAINEDKQGTLFGLPGPQAAGGDLFDVPRDLSGKNITDILEPLQREISRTKADITALEASRQKAADDAVNVLRAQQVIPLDAARTPEQKETARLAETENEYRKYYVNAVRSFGDKIFDIRNNSLIKAAFVRDVQRLAKSDVEAAIRLVAAVNEAAVKYGGKPVLTARNRIHQELENMRSRRAVETGIGGVAFAPVQPVRHTKTGAELFAVKLATRVDADMFGVLKQRAKANDGYYSKFSRAFLFDRQEDAEAFRAEFEERSQRSVVAAERVADSEYGASNKIVTQERYEELRQRMRAKLGQLNTGFDPEILAMGAEMAAFHVETGARKFADFARRMIDELGDAVRPYLKSIYISARHLPGMEELADAMDSYDNVMSFDLDKLDNPTNNLQQPEANAERAKTLEAQATLPTEADKDISLQGYYDTTGATKKDESEYGNLRPEENFKKDLVRFSKRLARVLGWEHDTDKKGKTEYVLTNVAPAGGDGHFILWKPGTDYGVYVSVTVNHSGYVAGRGYTDDLQIEKRPYGDILWRITSREKKYIGYRNYYVPANVTVGKLAALVNKEIKKYIGDEKAGDFFNDHVIVASIPKTQGNESKQTDKQRVGRSGPLEDGRKPAEPAVANGGERTGGTGENHRKQSESRSRNGADDVTERVQSGRSAGVHDRPAESGISAGEPGGGGNKRTTDERDLRPVEKNRRNHVIERGAVIAPRGDISKIKANVAAIRLAKTLTEEERAATPEEKTRLEKYTGWGGLSAVFKEAHPYYNELKEVLAEDEYDSARASTTTSFFTPPEVVSSVWDMVERLGFKGGAVLEPSAGIGHFFGLMPPDLSRKSDLSGVELDRVSGLILKALYPDADIRIEGYEQQRIANNSLDLVVTNVPFGNMKVYDKFDKDLSDRFDIHDYFIAKSVRKLKPGGIGLFITSTATLDRSKALRNWVVNDGNADFIGAVRLNSDTFRQNAGTETSADIIVIRKRDEAGPSPDAVQMQDAVVVREASYDWEVADKKGAKTTEKQTARMTVNQYFADHPEKMAGVMRFGFEDGNALHPAEQRCAAEDGIDQSEVLASFVEALPQNIYEKAPVKMAPEQSLAGDGTKEGGLALIDGKPCIIQYGKAIPAQWNPQKVKGRPKAEAVRDYLTLKETINKLIDAESNDAPDIETLRAYLNNVYDRFVRKYGTLSKNNRLLFLRDDVDFPGISAIEEVKEAPLGSNEKYRITKSDIFSRRVIGEQRELTAESLPDAIRISFYKNGRLDIPFIAGLLNKTEEETTREMLATEAAFINPTTGLVEDRDTYLSGNVRDKLMFAQQANESGEFDANIRELSKIVPLDLPLHLIKISLGSTWIPTKVYEKFFGDKFGVTGTITRLSSNKYVAKLRNEGNNTDSSMGMTEAPASRLALDCMNNTQTTIMQSVYDSESGKTKRVKDPTATAQASIKQTELGELFESWCKEDGNPFAEELVTIYNNTFNGIVEKKIDVSSFDYFPNATHLKKPRPHQKTGVLRGLSDAVLLANEVGTGKTITLISTAMEMRRLGIAKKPCIVVQRSTYNQFVNEIKALYPGAKVLVPSAKDLTAAQRQQLYSKIAYNDWDIVVLYHGYLDSIPDDPRRVNQYLDQLIDEKLEQMRELSDSNAEGSKWQISRIKKEIENIEDKKIGGEKSENVKQIEKAKANARARVSRLLDRRTDNTMTFEQLGIDALLVDEAHNYKKLGFNTSLQNIKGIDTAASQRAQSMRLKTSYILGNNQGKNVVFATGTPISNTMAEMWTWMRYLLPTSELERYEIADFDSFVRNFGTIEESAEFNAAGKFKVSNRFASYSNTPELLAIWKKIAYTVLTEDVPDLREGVGTPRLEGGKPSDLMLEQTPALKQVMKGIRAELARFENLTPKEKKEQSYIPLVMFGLAKRAAVDVRLVNPDLPDEPGSKTNIAVREVLADLKATDDYKGTIAIFCDSYQSSNKRFNLFEDIKGKLVGAGIPAEQIAIINDYATDEQKGRLFERVNTGDVRVVLGSTEKLGVGVNIQQRLHLLVQLDVPIRPMDYLQRLGRILRQGNMHLMMDKTVRILRLGVKQTLDVTGYQRLLIKDKFIRQVMKGDTSQRTIEEEDLESSDSTNFSQMMASLSGSQAALALSLEQNKLRKLTNQRDYHRQNQVYIADKLRYNRNVMATTEKQIEKMRQEKAEITSLFPEGKIVSVSVGNKTATAQEEIETLIDRTLTKVITKEADALRNDHKRDRSILKSEIKINDYLFDISVELKREYDIFSNKLRVFRSVSYACRDLSFIRGSVGANVENILKNVAYDINPEEIDREIKQHEVGLEKAQRENESLEPQAGKDFPKQAELEATENKVAELQTQMEAELNEIEAQEEQEQVEAIDISSFIEEDTGDGTRFRDGAVGSSGINAAADRAKVEATAEATAVRLAGALHTPVEVVRDVKEITDADAGRQKRKRAAKGWYDTETGKAVLVLPNVESAADAEATVLHEAVGHMGLRAVLGERFGDFLDRVYMDEDGSLQEPIDRMAGEEQHRRSEVGQELHPATEARRIATEEYLAELAEGNTTPGRFARIIGAVRRWFREVLGVPLRVSDRDIAYMLWLSKHRLSSVRSAGEAVARTAGARRVRAALYGSEPVRYRIIMDDATPENIERYSVQEWLKTHRLPGVEFGEHWDDFARMVYDHATDLGRSAIHQLYGDVPLAATKRYLALRDLREVTDRAGYNHIIGELIKVLPRERRQEIVASQKKHLEFIFSDEYKSPLRRRTSKDEKPLPENFKYAAEYVEELLKKRKQQKAIAPAGEIEPTIIYDKHNKKHLLENILFDSTMPVRMLQEEITRRGGKIDDITNVYEHLNHYSSVTKVALQKYTEDYINPMLERISGLAKLTGADAEAVADYLSAESSLERDLSGVPALSPDPKSDWNREVAEAIIKAFRDVAGRKRVEAVERDGIGGIPAEERAELPAGLLEKVTRDGLASLDAAELSDLREAPVSAMWRAVNAVNDRVLDMLIEDGMMAQETRRLVKGHNWKYYVPLRSYDYSFRDKKGNIAKFDATELYDFIDARHTSGRLRQVVQEAEGRFTKPFNPVVQMVNIGIGAVISAKTNRMRQSALRLVQNTKGGGDLFRVNRAWMAKAVGNRWVMTTIDPSVEDIELSKEARKKIAQLDKELQQAKKAHDEQGIAILESQIDEAERYNIVREYRATDDGGETFGREAGVSQTLQRQRCVECYVNGIKYIVTFADPAVSNAINGYHRLSIPQWVDNTVGNATRWLSRAFTSRNPAFVTVNFLRDVQHAALVHALDRGGDLRGFVRNVAPGMAAITREVRGKARPLTVAELRGADMLTNEGRQRLIGLFGAARVYDTLYDYFRENGGETGFVHGKSVEEAERDVRRYVAFRTGTVGNLLQKTKKSERPAVALSYVARKSGATAVAEAFDRASRVAENTSRFATFVASLEQGKTMLRAVSDAKNVTVNFNRRGVATRALGMFYVFFNASMQGAAQVGRVAWRNRQRFAGAVAGMVSAGFLESLLLDFFLAGQGDDRDYISEYDRRNNLIIPLLGTRGFLKLPLPQGFRAFHGLGVLLHDAYVGKITAEECGRSMLGALYEDFSPVASPSSGGDLLRVVVPTAATPFYDIAVGRDAFGYPVGKRSFDDAPDYPLSEMGLRNVNRAILVFCRGLNALGGGDRDTPAGLRENGEIDPLLRGLFEWNPSHVEHVLTYYGGGMGKFAKDVVHTTQSLVDTDAEMNSYDLPIVNRLFGTAREENPASRYYALRERMNNLSAVQKRKGETDGPDAERVQLFREYDRIVRRIRKVLSGTNPGAAEYERLQEELNEAMKEYLTKDGQLYD